MPTVAVGIEHHQTLPPPRYRQSAQPGLYPQGLGKTMESLALMLHRPRPDNPACTAGTLVVTPPSILKQWAKEVHTNIVALLRWI